MSAALPAERVRFTPSVILTREEAFTACQALADADRCLVGVGRGVEAGPLGALFDLLEDRLTATQALSTQTVSTQALSTQALSTQALSAQALSAQALSAQALSGSYSIDSEFTQ